MVNIDLSTYVSIATPNSGVRQTFDTSDHTKLAMEMPRLQILEDLVICNQNDSRPVCLAHQENHYKLQMLRGNYEPFTESTVTANSY